MCNLGDSRLLFNMADHMLNNTETQMDNFFEIIDDVLAKVGTYQGAKIPTTRKETNAILNEGVYGLFGNLPHEEVIDIGGYACISLVGNFKRCVAHGIPVAWSEIPMSDGEGNSTTRNWDGIHGCQGMMELLQQMKLMNPVCYQPTYYGFLVLWSNGFLRSYVCQKDNSVWIVTCAFPDPEGSATSPFHTHVLAIGRSSQDHTKVINYYASQIKELMKGVTMFCDLTGKYVHVHMGLLAYITD